MLMTAAVAIVDLSIGTASADSSVRFERAGTGALLRDRSQVHHVPFDAGAVQRRRQVNLEERLLVGEER